MSPSSRAGLVLLGLLSAIDLFLPLLTDGESPPMGVALVAAALGLASLPLIVSAWRGARRALLPLIVLRAVSAISAIPALLEADVPTGVSAGAAAGIAVSVVGIVLILPAARRPVSAGVR